jgi:hypothetical protein
MSNLTILLAQTKGEATIEILSLLLVAAVIGYVTAWLFYKARYAKRIQKISYEKDKLKISIISINTDKSNLHKILLAKNIENEHLIKEVNALKALYAEAVHEKDDITE